MGLEGLILVGSPDCAPCAQAAQWLVSKGVTFRKVSIVDDERLQKWVIEKTGGQRTVPQFFYGGEWIRQGFPLVRELVESGRIPSSAGQVTQLS